VFDAVGGRFLRFPAFSGSHGWQWFREIYLSNSSLWSYDLPANTWRDLRPLPAPVVRPLRCASWDAEHQVAVLFGGEGSDEDTHVYDPYTNTWARLRPQVHPGPRSGGNMAYHAGRKVHVLFGTQYGDDPHTWTYDLRKNEWRDRRPATQPPTDRNDAVLAYDGGGQVVVALARVADTADGPEVTSGHLETWAYNLDKNEWRRMRPAREPDGWANRRRVLVALPDLNLLLAEVYANPSERIPGVDREQQVWTYRYAAAKPRVGPLPPAGVKVKAEARAAVLTWDASPSPGVTGYTVYRGTGELPWRVEFGPVARVDGTAFRDEGLKPGVVYYYFVRARTGGGAESTDSVKVRTQPRVVEDVVVSVTGAKEVLRWAANPERGIKGYRVYRMEGPKVNGPGQKVTRVTDEPVKETTFTDPKATRETKRYWVVAVDGLGQEGFPSAPAWHYRQFRKYYEPFVGPWHQ
jgi:hypothetical protein